MPRPARTVKVAYERRVVMVDPSTQKSAFLVGDQVLSSSSEIILTAGGDEIFASKE